MITDKDKDYYKENGYVIVDNMISNQGLVDIDRKLKNMVFLIIDKVKNRHADIQNIFDNIDDSNVLSKGIEILESINHEYISEFYDTLSMANNPYAAKILSNNKILEDVNCLLGKHSDMPLFITSGSLLFAYQGDNIYTANKWHTDIFYTYPEGEYIHFWAPLIEDSFEDLGALHVMQGSHKNQFEGEVRSTSRQDSNIYRYTVSDSLLNKYKDKVLEMKLGQGVFFDKHLVHRGGNNTSNRSRFGVVGFYHSMDSDKFTPYKFDHPKSLITSDEYFDQKVLKQE
jgi:ectoine hydroxylase-related dioxygenase (phytanoyl-CoA dioxygenase family)